ncbi:hypothetical protein AQJ54_01990 [Streptomyces griseorubiginosus]|uniref:Uncharacterized protein n=1 Tax=Streptomyces griseorubiginosus TaxID=67304 RepID=A0A101SCZ6_9ACTN|nr:hypothetical protein AQJ54_01990 [Streptomyces griseorubiginosus]
MRYWNEETQRWEDGDGGPTATGPVTPPPSATGPVTPPPPPPSERPGTVPPQTPVWPPAAGSDVTGAGAGTVAGAGTAAGPGTETGPGARGAGAGAAADVPGPGAPADVPGPVGVSSPPPPSPPVGWPGAGGGSTWHGPGVPDGGWSSVEQVGGGGVPSAEWSGSSWSTGGTGGTGGHTAVVPPTPPAAPAAARNRRLVWSVLGGAAAVGVVTTLVLTLVVGGGDKDDQGGGGSPSPTHVVSQQGEPEDSPTPSPTEESASPLASAPQLPDGYELYVDEEGFRIARPVGWSRSTVPSQFGIDVVNYRSPGGEQRLQVYQIAESSPEESFALYLSADTTKPDGFKKLDLRPVDDDGFTGRRLEYVADTLSGEPDLGRWHVYDERFVAQDGLIYAVAAYGLDKNGGQDELKLLTSALKGFCAPYSCDPAAID